MYKTVKEAQKVKGGKQSDLDAGIDDILNRIKTFTEDGWNLIQANQFSRMAILPLSRAIRESLAELEDLVLDHREATSDPDLREKMKWLRTAPLKKANES